MVARGDRFRRTSLGVPAGALAIFIVKAASEPELNAAIERIADAVADFMMKHFLERQSGAGSISKGDSVQRKRMNKARNVGDWSDVQVHERKRGSHHIYK